MVYFNQLYYLRVPFIIVRALFCVPTKMYAEKILVTIDHVVKELDEETSCAVKDWENLEGPCSCCIIKRVPLLRDKKMSAKEILDYCMQHKRCDEATINEFLKTTIGDYSLASLDEHAEKLLKKLLLILYEKSALLKAMIGKEHVQASVAVPIN